MEDTTRIDVVEAKIEHLQKVAKNYKKTVRRNRRREFVNGLADKVEGVAEKIRR